MQRWPAPKLAGYFFDFAILHEVGRYGTPHYHPNPRTGSHIFYQFMGIFDLDGDGVVSAEDILEMANPFPVPSLRAANNLTSGTMLDFDKTLREGSITIQEVLRKKDKWALQQRWRETYAVGIKERHGKWRLDDFDWRAFSDEMAPALSGAAAVEAYEAEEKAPVWMIPERDDEGWGFKVIAPTFSVLRPLARFDVYVSSVDLSWTLVLPHEIDWFGPFFSRAEWQQDDESEDEEL